MMSRQRRLNQAIAESNVAMDRLQAMALNQAIAELPPSTDGEKPAADGASSLPALDDVHLAVLRVMVIDKRCDLVRNGDLREVWIRHRRDGATDADQKWRTGVFDLLRSHGLVAMVGKKWQATDAGKELVEKGTNGGQANPK